jgi:hypothetical protein
LFIHKYSSNLEQQKCRQDQIQSFLFQLVYIQQVIPISVTEITPINLFYPSTIPYAGLSSCISSIQNSTTFRWELLLLFQHRSPLKSLARIVCGLYLDCEISI